MATRQEILDKIQERRHISAGEIAELFMDLVNSGGSRAMDFADVVCNEHRFLQSEAFNLFIFCIEKWAKAYEEGKYDGRNEHVCKLSDVTINSLKEAGMW